MRHIVLALLIIVVLACVIEATSASGKKSFVSLEENAVPATTTATIATTPTTATTTTATTITATTNKGAATIAVPTITAAPDIIVRLHEASNVKETATAEHQEIEKRTGDKRTELQKNKKQLQNLIEVATIKLHNLRMGVQKAFDSIHQIEKSFIKDLGYGTMEMEDLPLASHEKKETGFGALDCPIDCDPKKCDKQSAPQTQCFKVDRTEGKKTHLCAPFDDKSTLRCPNEYVRCAMVAPKKGMIHELLVTEGEYVAPIQPFIIEGYNLHQCVRLLFVPEDIKCVPENMKLLLDQSKPIMGLAGSTSYPHIGGTETSQTAEFADVKVLKKGTFKVCLAQFAKNDKGTTVILGVEPIGTVKAIQKTKATTTTTTTTVAPKSK